LPAIDARWFVGLQGLLVLAGALALLRARRYFRRGGILSWREVTIVNGTLQSESLIVALPSVDRGWTGTALVDPAELDQPATPYRAAASREVRSFVLMARSAAIARARTLACTATALCATSALCLWLALVFR
jgi:hypothetical protein